MNKQVKVGDTFVYTQALADVVPSDLSEGWAKVGNAYKVVHSHLDSRLDRLVYLSEKPNLRWSLNKEQFDILMSSPVQLDLEEHCSTQGALKFDTGKVDYSLAPGKAIGAVCQALEYGAGKYGRDNYRKPPTLSPERLKAGVLRHLLQDLGGELLDSESGLPHTYHAAAGLAMLHETTCEEAIGARYEAPDENVTKD